MNRTKVFLILLWTLLSFFYYYYYTLTHPLIRERLSTVLWES